MCEEDQRWRKRRGSWWCRWVWCWKLSVVQMVKTRKRHLCNGWGAEEREKSTSRRVQFVGMTTFYGLAMPQKNEKKAPLKCPSQKKREKSTKPVGGCTLKARKKHYRNLRLWAEWGWVMAFGEKREKGTYLVRLDLQKRETSTCVDIRKTRKWY